ncbi:hypothetical protein Tco_0941159 [Tanacetum coccineum]|uniref:Uncharacterized protein n=1 Tax=Tanacetum coccineum TaxID=301880 RepID=A0ABQ5DW15_9ASTR
MKESINNIDWDKVVITSEIMDYVLPKYGKMINGLISYSMTFFNTSYKEPKVAKEPDVAKETKVAKGSTRRIRRVRCGVLSNLEWAPRLYYFGIFDDRFPIRRIGSSKYDVLLEIVFALSVDQGIIYYVSDEVDTVYSLKSGNGLELV